MSRITRTTAVNGIEGNQWFPALEDGNFILGRGEVSEDAKRAENRTIVASEAEAIEKLRSGMYWIRMTADGQEKNLISPDSILIDGQPLR